MEQTSLAPGVSDRAVLPELAGGSPAQHRADGGDDLIDAFARGGELEDPVHLLIGQDDEALK